MDNVSNATPQEFIAMGATPEQAASLAVQADAMAGRRGFAAQAEAMHSLDGHAPPPKAAPPTPPTAQEMSDMARAHEQNPVNDVLSAHFAPPMHAYDYEFPHADNPTDADIASDAALKEACLAAKMPTSIVRNIAADIPASLRAYEKQTPAQRSATMDSTIDRLDAMWKKNGEGSYEDGMAVIKQGIERMPAQGAREAIATFAPLFTPLAWDQLYQFFKHAR